jgi:hypothetical protein
MRSNGKVRVLQAMANESPRTRLAALATLSRFEAR